MSAMRHVGSLASDLIENWAIKHSVMVGQNQNWERSDQPNARLTKNSLCIFIPTFLK